jgi:KipI family sensor histidine kinase inhibitor
MSLSPPRLRIMGDRGVLVEFGEQIAPETNRRVQEALLTLEAAGIAGIRELAPGYRSLLVIYDPLIIEPARLMQCVQEICRRPQPQGLPEPKCVTIPVLYGGEHGPDLPWVAGRVGLSAEEVVRRHCAVEYRVYMIGFTPGYPYLGELPAELAVPRRDTPRTRVPKGSVAIAQRQTGIYPSESPGGWHIIGWTPVTLFDPRREPPALLEMGDRVRFAPIDPQEVGQWRP